MKSINIGILSFHGDVSEHLKASLNAAKKLRIKLNITLVKTKYPLKNLDGLIIPGGESTTIYKLCEREDMFESMRKIKNIFGTCAGAIMLAKDVLGKIAGQKTLQLMNIQIDRNAYGRQSQSFEKQLKTNLGSLNAIFIRAPKIKKVSKEINILAKYKDEILSCEQRMKDKYYLATCFHPEFTSTIFHQHFLKQITSYSEVNSLTAAS